MQSGLPVTAESFVAALKQQLTDVVANQSITYSNQPN
jgi:hypothetical protein